MSQALQQRRLLKQLRDARQRMQEAVYARTQNQVAALDREREACAIRASADRTQVALEMSRGDRAAWWLHAACARASEEHGQQIAHQREELAARAFTESIVLAELRLRADQAERLLEHTQHALRVEEERRAQTVSDDRFAARAHWNKSQRS